MNGATLRTGALVLALALLAAPALADFKRGEPVVFRGRVTDAGGRPLANVGVVLTVSRNTFRLRTMSRERSATLSVPSLTDANGFYQVAWRWDRYYNVFELKVALEVRRGGQDTYQVFHRVNLTGNVFQLEKQEGAKTLEFPLIVEDTTDLESLRAFLASIRSDDEKRIYDEVGLPDRIDVAREDYDPDRSWWYFAAGKVYRFRNDDAGRAVLDQVETFDPVSDAAEPMNPDPDDAPAGPKPKGG